MGIYIYIWLIQLKIIKNLNYMILSQRLKSIVKILIWTKIDSISIYSYYVNFLMVTLVFFFLGSKKHEWIVSDS